ncbi:protein translocase subunit SecF [Dehalococcoidales bacterium]|nr:protein translocase subunit SecF [Dehalococcoidales bacterium]
MVDITGKRFWFFLISVIIIFIGIISLAVFGPRVGIEFSSGSMMIVSFDEQRVEHGQLRQELAGLGYANAIVQYIGDGDFSIRTPKLSDEEKTQLEDALIAKFGNLEVREFYSVSPMVAEETLHDAAIAIAVAAVGVLLYITWAFRRMPSPFRYGTCAIIALIHDVLVVLGVFSILGAIPGWEINLMFITGVLAVIGYSINNTVVVFDRIRENLAMEASFEVIVNNSLIETLSRSLNISLTTIFVVLALLLFVGATIQNFAVVLLIGIIAGTFSSICIAPQLLVVWEKREWSKFIQWLPLTAKKL